MKAKDKSILQQIQERYPGTDPDIDIDWEIGGIFFNAGEKQGIEKVVEWVETHGDKVYKDLHPDFIAFRRIMEDGYQAQVKEWGLLRQEMPK